MQEAAYQQMAAVERDHWWYRARRATIARLLRRLDLDPEAQILEVGAGTGFNLGWLSNFGDPWGVEPAAKALAAAVFPHRLVQARAGHLPFAAETFDVALALDVLEHLHDELAALDEMVRVLRPGGAVVVYVPAYQFLWGHEDVASEHLRRYRRSQLRRLLIAAGLEITFLGYTSTVLFPAIAAVKVGKRLLYRGGPARPDVATLPSAFWNDVLTAVGDAEGDLATTVELPFGASIIGLARKA